MPKQSTLKIQLDENIKMKFEDICSRHGLSALEAIRMFVEVSIQENGFPFASGSRLRKKRVLGLGKGKFEVPDDIYFCNPEIEEDI